MADDKKDKYTGYIYLDRNIQESWMWEERPFSKGQAWIDLILLANHTDRKIPYKDKLVTCKRGTVNLSVLYLANRWGWNKKTVDKFLKQLQDGGSIEYKPSQYRTTIFIINYGTYQHKQPTKFQQKGQRYGQRKPTSVLGSDEMRDNSMDNSMDITNKLKVIKSNNKELKVRVSKEKELKENIDDSLFREEHNGLSREEWESGTRMMGQPY